MIETTRSHLSRLGLAAVLSASALSAQDLEVHVIPDPNAGLATYTATITAPPGSTFYLFAAASSLGSPIPIPGFLGGLEIDPLSMLLISPGVTVGPSGLGTYDLTTPIGALLDIELPFQALVLDPNLTLAFSQLATSVYGLEQPGPAGLQWDGGYTRHNRSYHQCFSGATPGDRLEVKVKRGGVVIARQSGIADASGRLGLHFPVDLKPGDVIEICRNGRLVRSWLWR